VSFAFTWRRGGSPLIAAADGISVQALFDADGWPADRQLARLHELVDPLLTIRE